MKLETINLFLNKTPHPNEADENRHKYNFILQKHKQLTTCIILDLDRCIKINCERFISQAKQRR